MALSAEVAFRNFPNLSESLMLRVDLQEFAKHQLQNAGYYHTLVRNEVLKSIHRSDFQLTWKDEYGFWSPCKSHDDFYTMALRTLNSYWTAAPTMQFRAEPASVAVLSTQSQVPVRAVIQPSSHVKRPEFVLESHQNDPTQQYDFPSYPQRRRSPERYDYRDQPFHEAPEARCVSYSDMETRYEYAPSASKVDLNYADIVRLAFEVLRDPSGSTVNDVFSYVITNFDVQDSSVSCRKWVAMAIEEGLAKRKLTQVGPGRFLLSKQLAARKDSDDWASVREPAIRSQEKVRKPRFDEPFPVARPLQHPGGPGMFIPRNPAPSFFARVNQAPGVSPVGMPPLTSRAPIPGSPANIPSNASSFVTERLVQEAIRASKKRMGLTYGEITEYIRGASTKSRVPEIPNKQLRSAIHLAVTSGIAKGLFMVGLPGKHVSGMRGQNRTIKLGPMSAISNPPGMKHLPFEKYAVTVPRAMAALENKEGSTSEEVAKYIMDHFKVHNKHTHNQCVQNCLNKLTDEGSVEKNLRFPERYKLTGKTVNVSPPKIRIDFEQSSFFGALKTKRKDNHPGYPKYWYAIWVALRALDNGNGASVREIASFITEKFPVKKPQRHEEIVCYCLKSAMSNRYVEEYPIGSAIYKLGTVPFPAAEEEDKHWKTWEAKNLKISKNSVASGISNQKKEPETTKREDLHKMAAVSGSTKNVMERNPESQANTNVLLPSETETNIITPDFNAIDTTQSSLKLPVGEEIPLTDVVEDLSPFTEDIVVEAVEELDEPEGNAPLSVMIYLVGRLGLKMGSGQQKLEQKNKVIKALERLVSNGRLISENGNYRMPTEEEKRINTKKRKSSELNLTSSNSGDLNAVDPEYKEETTPGLSGFIEANNYDDTHEESDAKKFKIDEQLIEATDFNDTHEEPQTKVFKTEEQLENKLSDDVADVENTSEKI